METKNQPNQITYQQSPSTTEELITLLNPLVKEWFFSRFQDFALSQKYAVKEIHERNNVLVSAPTGSGKTLSCFLSIINELVNLAEANNLQEKVYCVYISPLKALNNDIFVNLETPLREIEKLAQEKGKNIAIRTLVRTGDTTAYEKTKMLHKPPHILVTTPESLAIVLSSAKFSEHLKELWWVVVDEVHALAENKRGVHLSLSLERLQHLSQCTRIGLSATVAPLEEVARFLVGADRPCTIVDIQFAKQTDIKVISPVPDLVTASFEERNAALYNMLNELIQQHKTTLIFTNTRAATERVVHNLKTLFPSIYAKNIGSEETLNLIGAHHGSLSKAHRLEIEQQLRDGKLRCVVCLEGSSKVLTNLGDWKMIKELKVGDSVQSLDKNMKVSSNKIINTFKIPNQDNLVSIKVKTGEEITCTKDHKFLIMDCDGNLSWSEASRLSKRDFIGTIRKNEYYLYDQKSLKELAFESYPDEYFVSISPKLLKLIRNKISAQSKSLRTFWINNLKTYCSYSHFICLLQGKYVLKVIILKKITKIIDLSNAFVFENIQKVSSSKVQTPKIEINGTFMRFLGFMYAEGYISKRDVHLSNRNLKVLSYYHDVVVRLRGNAPFSHYSSSGTPVITWTSMFLSKFLINLGFKSGRKSRISHIPRFIFRLSSNYVWQFISGYMDGDGYLEKKGKRVYSAGICTTSREMAEDIHRLLIRENILSVIRSRYCDEVQSLNDGRTIIKKGYFYSVCVLGGENLRRFAKLIYPVRENLKSIKDTLKTDGYCNDDVIPNLGKKIKNMRLMNNTSTYKLGKSLFNPTKYELGQRNISRNQFIKYLQHLGSTKTDIDLATSDIFWSPITAISHSHNPEYVYNIEVEQDHNYFANSFITKNCSTSLELGIDIGYIDLVILLGSPKSVARALQRIGRSGHKLHDTAKGRIIVLDRDDLVECALILKEALERKIDRLHIPTNCLDVLAQQIFGILIADVWNIDELFATIRRSYCYQNLSRADFDAILSYLAGEYVSLRDRYIFAKIWKNDGRAGRRNKLARLMYMTNIGTIPDQTGVRVKIQEKMIGTIDEGFLEQLRPGDLFVLGGSVYEFKFSRGNVAQVVAAHGRLPTVPSWVSEMLPLSFDLSVAIQKFRKHMSEKFEHHEPHEDILRFIHDYLSVDENACRAIYSYFKQQYEFALIPHEKRLLVEQYKDMKETYYIFHSLYGRRVNDVISRALAYAVARQQKRDVRITVTDNGFVLTADVPIFPLAAFSLLKSAELPKVMVLALDKSQILMRRFSHCAARALMILRNYKGNRKSVGRQQVSARILLSAVQRISQDFPILKEARREVLEDKMDLVHAIAVLKSIEDGSVKIVELKTQIPSPFAFNLALQGYSDVLRIEDKIEFVKRLHQMVLAKIELERGKRGIIAK